MWGYTVDDASAEIPSDTNGEFTCGEWFHQQCKDMPNSVLRKNHGHVTCVCNFNFCFSTVAMSTVITTRGAIQ